MEERPGHSPIRRMTTPEYASAQSNVLASRCAFATDLCLEKNPELETKDDGRKVRCWHAEEIALQEEEKQHV